MFLEGFVIVDLEELQKWFKNRPKWLQDCARRLVQKGSLSEQDYIDLLAICKGEAIGQIVSFSGLPSGSLALQESIKPIRLESIANISGINALFSIKPLVFSKEPICIVYGRNGSGKSGYVRLLKHACGVKNPGDLLSNIFLTDDQSQTAEFTFIEDTKTKTSQWAGEPLPELRGVEIYDTACGLVYINEENEVAYEPWLLRLFTELTDTCTDLAYQIKTEIDGKISAKPAFPKEYETTSASAWYESITENTTSRQVNKETAWKPEDETELTEINKRLSETNPSEKAIELRRQAILIMELVVDLKKLSKAFEDSRCSEYLKTKNDASVKRKVADEDAARVFAKAPLAGIGSEAWRLLWDAARKYSDEHAYRTKVFPNVAADARCVLCQRELDQESRDRFVSFENFVKGELQRLATESEENVKNASALIPDVPTTNVITMRMEAANISDHDSRVMVTDFTTAIAKRKKTFLDVDKITGISPLPANTTLINLVQIARNLSKKARSYDKDVEGQNRPQLEKKCKELLARKWLHQQRQAINSEIAHLDAIQKLRAALDLTNTTALSRRKSSLAEELITNAYIQRFQDELKGLKAEQISVDLKKTRTEVGRVYHRICLKNTNVEVKTSKILSEGEFRIVSLAAFLADTEGRGSKTPFIFDDPISSLDHVYEEIAAQRLVKLSESRQVIVFTHRLSLIGYLTKYAEKKGVKPEVICLSRYLTGQVTNLPINLKRTDRSVNVLLNERLAEAKKAFTQDDVAYENVAKSLCNDIRILIERMVEMDLLNEVIRRFCQEVNTKGRIGALAKITETDCNFVDEYMTKYSRYEHSQPDEAPIPLPPPDELESDLNAIKSFIDSIRSRNN